LSFHYGPFMPEVALLIKSIFKDTEGEVGMRTASSAPMDIEGVQVQLRRILASRFFSHSERLHRFLSFAANHALAASGERLKEYMVGLEVYDRGPDYDPRIDPIVRVEARRLRAKLRSYYASIGRNDPVLVELPKGTYMPRFRPRTNGSRKPRLVLERVTVLPFVNFAGSAKEHFLGQGLMEELIHQLTRVPNLSVVAWPSETSMPYFDDQLWSKSGLMLRGSIRSGEGNISKEPASTGQGMEGTQDSNLGRYDGPPCGWQVDRIFTGASLKEPVDQHGPRLRAQVTGDTGCRVVDPV
jgi:hypothetical protein